MGRISLAVGEGVTGAAAAERRRSRCPTSGVDQRFMFLGGFDRAGLTSMLSVPLTWNDRVVGVLNVQSVETRRFAPGEISFLSTIAALLGGIVEKGRLGREQEAQLEALTALDAARAELLSVVTHELRTPLSVVRAYVDLLADAAAGIGEAPARASAEDWRNAAGRPDHPPRPAGRLDPRVGARRGPRRPAAPAVRRWPGRRPRRSELLATAAPQPSAPLRASPVGRLLAVGDEARFRQVIEQLLENEAKYAPRGWGVSVGTWHQAGEVRIYVTDDGPGIPSRSGSRYSCPSSGRPAGAAAGPASASYAARRLMEAMGGRVWIEGNGYGGSRFVVAMPVAPGR